MKNNETKEIFVPCKYIKDDGTILDFTGLYEVSDQGRVRSLNYGRTKKIKVKKQTTYEDKSGNMYYQVGMRKNNKRYILKVHRLVLSSFRADEYFLGDVVNHKVERTPDSCINDLSNLEWLTQKNNSNTLHARTLQSISHIGKYVNRPDLSKKVKVTFSDGTQEIFPSVHEAGRSLGISSATIVKRIQERKGYYKKLNLHFEYVL